MSPSDCICPGDKPSSAHETKVGGRARFSVLFQGLFVFITSLIFIVSLCDLYFYYEHFIDKDTEMLS